VGDVEALVALQADEPGARGGRERLRRLGLADPGLALEQERLADGQRQEDGRRQTALGEVRLGAQRGLDLLDRSERPGVGHVTHLHLSP
jgi:hypothetical protein